MIRYRFNVTDALKRLGVTNNSVRKNGNFLSQSTFTKLNTEDTSLSLDTLDKLCALLDMQPKDIIYFEATDATRELRKTAGLDKDQTQMHE